MLQEEEASAMAERQQQQHQPLPILVPVPSTVSLLCASCSNYVTPCLVCAHPLPYCASVSWQDCGNCRLRNPLGDQKRRLLGIPPALSLPPCMGRRVLVAHVGRSEYVMAAHAQYLQIQHVLPEAEDIVEAPSHNESSKCNDGSDLLHTHLPFIQCEGMIEQAPVTTGKKPLSASESSPNENNPSVPRARLTPEHHSKQIPVTDKTAGNCPNCGSSERRTFCAEHSQYSESALRLCKEQLLAVHCAEALSAELNCSYPICCSVTSSALNLVENKTCNSKLASSCASKTVGSLSFGILRLVNSFLAPDFDAWLVGQNVSSSDSKQHLEDILTNAEQFIQNRDKLLQLKRSMCKALAAQKQAAKDCKVLHRQSSKSEKQGCLLKQIFADRVLERRKKFMSVAEPFMPLLSQINLFLQFCYAQTVVSVAQPSQSLCTATFDASLKENETIPREKFSFEAVQMAISSWLLLYHDIAHATGVICN